MTRIDVSSAIRYRLNTMAASAPILDQLLSPLGDCLTPESAQKVADLRADESLQTRIHELGQKSNQGDLSDVERDEYETVVRYTNFISILQSKARKLLRTGE